MNGRNFGGEEEDFGEDDVRRLRAECTVCVIFFGLSACIASRRVAKHFIAGYLVPFGWRRE